MGKKKPETSVEPIHQFNAFLEDYLHDWSMLGSKLRYHCHEGLHSVWILVQYETGEDR